MRIEGAKSPPSAARAPDQLRDRLGEGHPARVGVKPPPSEESDTKLACQLLARIGTAESAPDIVITFELIGRGEALA
jgi:hypothetical protein